LAPKYSAFVSSMPIHAQAVATRGTPVYVVCDVVRAALATTSGRGATTGCTIGRRKSSGWHAVHPRTAKWRNWTMNEPQRAGSKPPESYAEEWRREAARRDDAMA